MANLFVDEPTTPQAQRVQRVTELVAGWVMLVFGLVLAVPLVSGLFVMLMRMSLPPNSTSMVVMFLCLAALSVFAISVGIRLVWRRPNAHGSLLSPAGWATLGFVFFGVGAALTILIVKAGGPAPLGLDLSLAGFAAVCALVARQVRRRSRARR
jgi:hypothetical protein